MVATLRSLLRVWRNTGPLRNAPATMKVAPVSERERANAKEYAAIRDG
jgi:hypothetical protein